MYFDISRADYWKSQGRKYCDFCKCWIGDNKPSISFHEGGKKHKENVAKRLKEIQRTSAKQAKENKKFENDLKKMENVCIFCWSITFHSQNFALARFIFIALLLQAAMAAYLKDVESNTMDLTANDILAKKNQRPVGVSLFVSFSLVFGNNLKSSHKIVYL